MINKELLRLANKFVFLEEALENEKIREWEEEELRRELTRELQYFSALPYSKEELERAKEAYKTMTIKEYYDIINAPVGYWISEAGLKVELLDIAEFYEGEGRMAEYRIEGDPTKYLTAIEEDRWEHREIIEVGEGLGEYYYIDELIFYRKEPKRS